METWLLLHYTLPSNPSARRVYVWRKLKRLGAILLNECVWILPDTARTAEQFQWLSAEIRELNGESYLWRSDLLLGRQSEDLIAQFTEQVESSYHELLKKLNRKNPNVADLARQYQQIVARDYFHSDVGKRVKDKLLSIRGGRS